ncbi:ras-GEF domain-containing family member 1B-like isoform X3 [Cloeon dipterum]|uniref:ras-GEF domain-containing family member 1B-like isoform X3 n=1 Tax=Cloeon dipterum TaxID=197152 RepID=UPI00321F6BF6
MVSPTLANEREMRPDQDPDEVSSRNQCCRTVDKPRDPDRTRDLFGLQLEVTSLLLEAERRKLSVLQRELQAALAEGGSIKAKEQQKHELILAISRIQGQHEQLEKEYRQHAIGVLRCSNTRGSGKSNRSQPAIGLKQTPKARPTIFGTVASDQTPKDGSSRRSLPQTPQSAKSFSTLINGPIGDAAASESGGSLDSVHDIQPSDENALVYKDGNLVSGPLDALLQHMVPTSDYFPDRAYLFAFLLSARLFIKPHELLGQVCQRCHIHKPESITAPAQFVRHIVQLLAEWTETFPYDFRDERVMAHVRELTQQCVALEPTVRREVSQLLQNLLHRLTALEQYEEFLQRINSETATPNIESLNVSDITELCPSPEKLAQQLTHIELERLSFIGPEEFVQAFAKENTKPETTSFRDLKKTRNLESYVQWFNRLSYFVATEVCKHVKKKARVRAVEYWVEVARECFNIGNFNSLMGIIAGLNMSPVSRLKKTWAKVSSGKFAILEHQMDPSSNFSSYRSTLKAAMWRSAGATDERQRIVIPFFSLLVKDLYFLNEGCASKLPSGHVNFEKCWQLAKQVTEFIAWKQVACPFAKDAKVTNFLQSTTVLSDEKALAIASFECEPPENSFEKERYKNLKAEINGTTSSTT